MAQIFPTKSNLIATKKSLRLAKLGYDLMDKKRTILIREMMGLIDGAASIQARIDETYAQAYASLQRANISLGNCEQYAYGVPVDETLTLSNRSVMGVELPTVTLTAEPFALHYGLGSTNSQLDEAVLQFGRVKQLTAELAEMESSVYRLAVAIKKTQKRANALQNILIPQFEATIRFISAALEEKEREDFGRLKVIKAQKK
ncbi:MAG: V-type ATP synthase subunit D [Oscillospiraceae bacterium]|jgi:V/A-type H+-transporting ATPase subunit D|nr:V-type ATP synthase subunit D [Oscillospiraceae bacterium]